MKSTQHDLTIMETLITEMGINSIKRKSEIIFKQKHFCTKDLGIIKETIAKVIEMD